MFLIDTNVLSELMRPKPNVRVQRWAASVPLPLRISVVTLEEIYFGLSARPNRGVSEAWERVVQGRCEVLPVTPDIARRAGELRGAFRRDGEQRSQADMLIAATAQSEQLVVATRNVKDFEGCGVPVLDPFARSVGT